MERREEISSRNSSLTPSCRRWVIVYIMPHKATAAGMSLVGFTGRSCLTRAPVTPLVWGLTHFIIAGLLLGCGVYP
jgi:hypothetical protein